MSMIELVNSLKKDAYDFFCGLLQDKDEIHLDDWKVSEAGYIFTVREFQPIVGFEAEMKALPIPCSFPVRILSLKNEQANNGCYVSLYREQDKLMLQYSIGEQSKSNVLMNTLKGEAKDRLKHETIPVLGELLSELLPMFPGVFSGIYDLEGFRFDQEFELTDEENKRISGLFEKAKEQISRYWPFYRLREDLFKLGLESRYKVGKDPYDIYISENCGELTFSFERSDLAGREMANTPNAQRLNQIHDKAESLILDMMERKKQFRESLTKRAYRFVKDWSKDPARAPLYLADDISVLLEAGEKIPRWTEAEEKLVKEFLELDQTYVTKLKRMDSSLQLLSLMSAATKKLEKQRYWQDWLDDAKGLTISCRSIPINIGSESTTMIMLYFSKIGLF